MARELKQVHAAAPTEVLHKAALWALALALALVLARVSSLCVMEWQEY